MSAAAEDPRSRRSVRGAQISVASSFLLLGALAVYGASLGLGEALGPDRDMAAWIEDLAAEVDPNAAAALEPFELRQRFRDKVLRCTGISAGTWPLHLDDLPGRTSLRHGSEAMPSLTVDFNALRAQGLRGTFVRRGVEGQADAATVDAVLAAGLLGVYAPGRPCPPAAG
ncbi:hypothetical protein P2H44_10920 [Albimonas sp. CAU 1670]|uniref:hypothetical protein n=1 Tax=Albimonas sp. CAU 1670 TaxID=3032599 RepID=UPI0023DA7A34|nr:hypothetical protein [Albimonas sp. CAU 1670]MDF2233063.1 hypothetical protein [Albimonas sp. CAU 1670]